MADYYSEDEYVTKDDLDLRGQYEGERNELGLRHGTGVARYSKHDKYEGEFKDGLRNGHGTYTFRNAIYIGSYVNGKRNGFGKMIYPDGSIYKGQWKDGARHGQGEYTFRNGDKFKGEYQNDIRHGVGTYFYAESDSSLTAHWVQGHQIGHGKWTNCNYTYEGRFEDYIPCDIGKYCFDNGCELHVQHSFKRVPIDVDIDEFLRSEAKWETRRLSQSVKNKNRPLLDVK